MFFVFSFITLFLADSKRMELLCWLRCRTRVLLVLGFSIALECKFLKANVLAERHRHKQRTIGALDRV